jgi:hypothetical protein
MQGPISSRITNPMHVLCYYPNPSAQFHKSLAQRYSCNGSNNRPGCRRSNSLRSMAPPHQDRSHNFFKASVTLSLQSVSQSHSVTTAASVFHASVVSLPQVINMRTILLLSLTLQFFFHISTAQDSISSPPSAATTSSVSVTPEMSASSVSSFFSALATASPQQPGNGESRSL